LDNSGKYKTAWGPPISLTVRTTTPSVPMALPLPPRRPQSRRRAALAFTVYKRSTPPVSSPFPPPPLRCHCAIVPPLLSRHETLPRSPSKLLDTALNSAPTSGAPSTSLSVPSSAPLLHRRRSPPLGLCHRGTPDSGEPSPLSSCQTGPSPRRLALRPLHRRPPAIGRPEFNGKSSVPMGEKTSLVSPRAERLYGLGQEGRGQMGLAHSNSAFSFFSGLHSKFVSTS
jgi:hypothetical protein